MMKEFLATVHAAHWDTSSSQSRLCKSTSVLLKNKKMMQSAVCVIFSNLQKLMFFACGLFFDNM